MTKTASPLITAMVANWPAPDNIVGFTTSRLGGFSEAPYNEFNLAQHVGDKQAAVDRNRQLLIRHCSGLERIQWLDQQHSTTVINAEQATLAVADASYTTRAGLGCAVLTADCLPLLICDDQGRQIAAIHAGWRGLAAGVIEKTLACFTAEPRHILVWLGPAISQPKFEVGSEVREVFLLASGTEFLDKTTAAFIPNVNNPGHYFADLYQLARIRLQARGISNIYGGDYCSFQQQERCYSFRRHNVTGRMASIIYRQGK